MPEETVQRKIALIERCLPVDSVIDMGGMWEVDGLYSRICRERFGIRQVTMIDRHESRNWRRNARLRKGIGFRKGDLSDERFMAKITKRYHLALAYDVLPHQIDLRHTLALMLSKTMKFFLISQPILPDEHMPFRNCLILLSGSRARKLIPFHETWKRKKDYWRNFDDARTVDPSHWIWGMTPSFIESLIAGFGFKLVHKEFWHGWLPKPSGWRLCGLIFRRT